MLEHLAAITAGLAFAVLIGHWATSALMRTAWEVVTARLGSTSPGGSTPHPEHPAALGMLERTLYVAAWQLGVREFLGLWLALKVAGNWKRWAEASPHGTGTISGRTSFNLFLVGSGTSLAFGVAGGVITQLLDRNDWVPALFLAVVVVAGAFGLGWYLQRSSYHTTG
jgi:hypothetical protein